MPLLEDDDLSLPDPTQGSFRDRLRQGRVVPIISDEAVFDQLLAGYVPFVEGYGSYTKIPQPMSSDLVRLVKHYKYRPRTKPLTDQALKYDYLNFVKNHLYRQARARGIDAETLREAAAQIDRLPVSDFARQLGFATFAGGRADPLLVLADLPFKTILTTSPYTFIEEALRAAKKLPRTEVCRWTKDLWDSIPSVIDAAYQPSEREPLVFHLLGLDRYVDSLVLTEDDYLEYLVNICQGQNNQAVDYVPALVRKAFSDDLIVLGFSLDSWAFRVLYAGLIKRNAKTEERGVCVQLPNTEDERKFLEDYIQREAKFEVFLGTLEKYVQEELAQVSGPAS